MTDRSDPSRLQEVKENDESKVFSECMAEILACLICLFCLVASPFLCIAACLCPDDENEINETSAEVRSPVGEVDYRDAEPELPAELLGLALESDELWELGIRFSGVTASR